jgi:hypothetical protein
MAAPPASLEKVTIASPLIIFEFDSVGIVGSIKCYCKAAEVNPVPFLGVALGFLNFANHARIHGNSTPFELSKRMQKSTRQNACFG